MGILCGLLGFAAGRWLDYRSSARPEPTAVAAATQNQATSQLADDPPQNVNAKPSSGLGVSRRQLRTALANPTEPRFHYRELPATEAPCLAGSLGDGLALVELLGPADNLTVARLTLPMIARSPPPSRDDGAPSAQRQLVVPEALYMVLLAREIAPEWQGASDWIEEFLPRTAGGSVATTEQGRARFTLARIERFGLVVLTAESR
jgi:hypothetical protein